MNQNGVETATQYFIRELSDEDEPWLLDTFEAFDKEAGFARPAMHPDPKVSIRQARKVAAAHLFLVAVAKDGRRMGYVAGVLAGHVFNPELLSFHEVLWWVEPKYRKRTPVAGMLMDVAIAWAKGKGARWIWWSLHRMTKVSPERLVAKGFQMRETQYLLEV